MQTFTPEMRLKQELVNSIMHGFGILFGIICYPYSHNLFCERR